MGNKTFPNVPMPLADFPVAHWRWDNFSVHEMACHDTAKIILIHEKSMDMLQRLRNVLAAPMVVHSAYRTTAYNNAIGGAAGSMHLAARAYDIAMKGHDPHEFERLARECGFTGFGFYPESNFIHIDTGPARHWGDPFPMYEDETAVRPAPLQHKADPAKVDDLAPKFCSVRIDGVDYVAHEMTADAWAMIQTQAAAIAERELEKGHVA